MSNLVGFVKRMVTRFGEAQGPNWATIIAWNGMTATVPIILAIVAILGLFLQGNDINVRQNLLSIFPQQMHGSLNSLFTLSKENNGKFAIVSVLAFMWAGSSLIGSFDNGMNSLYPSKPRGFVRQKLIGFGMILVFALLTVLLVASSSLLTTITNLSFMPDFLRTGVAAWLVQFFGGALDGFVLFLAIFWVIPTRRQRPRQVLPGAVFAGVALELFTLVIFPLYLHLTGGAAKEAQAAGVFFILMFFMWVLGIITMLGAAINAELYPASRRVDDPVMAESQGAVLGGKLGLANQAGGLQPAEKTLPQQWTSRERSRAAGVALSLLAAAAAVVGLGRERRRTGH